MCGFVGFFNGGLADEDENEKNVHAMADKIAHRGPDDEGFFVDDTISLGFRRLSIIDLAGGAQPIYNEDKSKIIFFNGEIYNYQTLRKTLEEKGHIFTTDSDTETILHGYEEYGEKLLPMLRGMFAFVIWDRTNKKLFGARDIFGIKPFFYYSDGKSLMFASEIKAFTVNPMFKKELNEERLPEYLCFEYIPSSETLFKNVYKLAPGSYIEVQDGEIKIEKYFDIKYNIDNSKTQAEWEDIIDKTFRESTAAHSIADVEVGCFLSGGVDSSYTANEMAKHNKVKTFSVGWAEKKYSELDDAKEFAKQLGVENYSKEISADEFFDVFKTVQYHMDEPLPNPSAVPLYFLTKKASEYVKVVLSGEGADELFGGYHYYRDPLEFEKYQRLPVGLRKAAASVARLLPDGFHGKRFLIRGATPLSEYYIRNNYVYNYTERPHILAHCPADAKKPSEFTRRYFDECKNEDGVTQMQYVDMKTWLCEDILVKADRMSMANSLELRVPFLDKEMLSVALSIPSEYRINDETTKPALRGAALKQLPEHTGKMVKKGFMTPLNDWLRQDKYYEIVRKEFLSDTAAKFFNVDAILKLLDDHKAGKAKNMKKIWSVYTFLVWYGCYFGENV